MNGYRDDGLLPTIATSTKLVSLAWARMIKAKECMSIMGFPMEQYDMDDISEGQRVALLGNTMVVPVIGALAAALLEVFRPAGC